jgi:hypothetical protein
LDITDLADNRHLFGLVEHGEGVVCESKAGGDTQHRRNSRASNQ